MASNNPSNPTQDELPDPVDLTHHLSRTTRARNASSIKEFYKYFQIPGIGQLAGGLPNEYYFPYDTLEAKVAHPNRWKPTPNYPPHASNDSSEQPSSKKGPPSSHLLVPHASGAANPLQAIDLRTALQYGQAQGYPSLYYWIRQFTRNNLHPYVPYNKGPEVILTCGNTDGFSKTIQALSDEWSESHDPVSERPGLLVERYCYMNAVQTAAPRGMNMVPVEMDDEGMAVEGKGGLRDVLDNWDFGRGRRPHLMYTVTVGQNPTSGTLGIERRKAIYELCVKYDIVIVEDDPYWYLQYASTQTTPVPKPRKSSGFEFIDSLIPSYLSIDYQGRVVRLDTFSKTVAPGCRLGWITAQPALVERILRITETSTQQPSGFVQAMVAELIVGPSDSSDKGRGGAADGSGWKADGFVRWLEGLRGNYERRMNTMADILEEGKYLVERRTDAEGWEVVSKKQIFSFVRPRGGMFIWVRFDFSTHPLGKGKSLEALQELSKAFWIHLTTKKYLVLVAPGTMFAPTEEIKNTDAFNCFRLCFAAIDEEEVESVSRRFVEGARSFWREERLGVKASVWAFRRRREARLRESESVEEVERGMANLMHMC